VPPKLWPMMIGGEFTALGRSADRRELTARLDESLEVLTGLWSGQPFSHQGAQHTFDGVLLLPPTPQQPRRPVWVSAMVRNERTLGRAAIQDGVTPGR